MTKGRPKGSKNKFPAPKAVINEWKAIYNSSDDGKAIVLKRLDDLGLEQELITKSLSLSHAKRGKNPELDHLLYSEVEEQLTVLQEAIKKSPVLLRLQEIAPKNNLIINLETLELNSIGRPKKREKKNA